MTTASATFNAPFADVSSTATLSFIDGPLSSFKYEGTLGTNFSSVRCVFVCSFL